VAELDMTQYLRPGDTVLIGQAAAEPPALVEKFIAAAHAIGGLTAFCGYTLSDAWAGVSPGQPNIKAYAAHGALRKLSAKGLVDIVPCHYGRIEDLITTGHIRVDVVLLQVAPADADGYYSLGATVDYAAVAAEQARVVLVEVNANMPRTSSSRRLHRSRVAASTTSSRVLADSPARSRRPARPRRAGCWPTRPRGPPPRPNSPSRKTSWRSSRRGRRSSSAWARWPTRSRGRCTAAGTCGCDPAWSATGWSISTRPGPWPTAPEAA
jgi:hypothetical protein